MLKIIGEHYYIDLDAIEKYVDMKVNRIRFINFKNSL